MCDMKRRAVMMTSLAVLAMSLPAHGQTPAPGSVGSPTGRISIRLTQAALIGSVSWGSGTLTFNGRRVNFRVSGLGAGGVGYATMTAVGEVHDLSRIENFAGSYAQARAGAVVGSAQVRGGLWLTNAHGVRIHLRPRRQGVALQLGGDAIIIELTR